MNGTAPSAAVRATEDAYTRLGLSKTFDGMTLPKAQKLVESRNDKQAEINRKFFNGDHWQQGAGWVGPRAGGTATDSVSNLALIAIEQVFVSQNVIAETTGRHVNGVLSRELHWKFVPKRTLGTVEVEDPDTKQKIVKPEPPSADEETLIKEAQDALVAWWDKRTVIETLQTLWASVLNTKRDVLRFFVPSGMVDAEGNVPSGSLEECLDLLWLQHLGSDEDTLKLQFPHATVYTHKKTRKQIGVFTYKEVKELDESLIEGAQEGEERAELTYLADPLPGQSAANTVLRVINSSGDITEPLELPLGGRLTMYEVARRPMITPQVVSQQKKLNMTETMESKNVEVAGFLFRTFFNAKFPGRTVGEGENARFVPDPVTFGPGYFLSLQGVEIEDEDGTVKKATPSMDVQQPVDTKTFQDTKHGTYLAMLQETHQLHYVNSGDSNVSAESRKQARDAYTGDLKYSATKLAGTVRWILETGLAMASYFAGQPGRYESLRAHVEVRISSGPVAPDDMRVAADMHEKGLWDWELSVAETGKDDVDAIKQRLEAEQAESAKREAETMARAAKLAAEINPPPPADGAGGTARVGANA